MKIKLACIKFAALVMVCGATIPCAQAQSTKSSAAPAGKAPPAANKDEDTIRKSARDFVAAYEKGDAKAVAAMWTENGEYEDDAGRVLRGREAIEKEFAAQFAERKGSKIDVKIQSVRFLTPDVAVEEGILRETSAGRELPTTTRYRAIDVREGGGWKIALCREWGGGQDHLDDLNWLVGRWKGTAKDGELSISFAWDEKQPILLAKLAMKPTGKSAAAQSETIKIGYDARRGAFHSWHTDASGGQSRAQWLRDGNRWLISAAGLTGDGKDLSGQFILSRIDNNNITWRAVDRIADGKVLPDATPIKLTRVTEGK